MNPVGVFLLVPLETDVEDREYPYSDDIIAAVDGGRKIEAIKILREESGLVLRDQAIFIVKTAS